MNAAIASDTTLDISEARKGFSRLPERLQEERLIWITRHSKRAFAVVDREFMEAVLETLEILRDPESLKMLQESLDDIRAGRLIDHADVEDAFQKGDSRDHRRLDSMDRNRMEKPTKASKKRK
jgi:PHD/YefM family antitoxin component YafN of YafNO toxin-antitoxin module